MTRLTQNTHSKTFNSYFDMLLTFTHHRIFLTFTHLYWCIPHIYTIDLPQESRLFEETFNQKCTPENIRFASKISAFRETINLKRTLHDIRSTSKILTFCHKFDFSQTRAYKICDETNAYKRHFISGRAAGRLRIFPVFQSNTACVIIKFRNPTL